MEKITVADIMTRMPIVIKPDTNLLECARKMVKKRVGSLLLVDKKKLVGFISEKDILWALVKKSKEDLSKIKAIDISPKKIAIIKPSSDIDDVLKKMKKLKFEKLPVVHDGHLVGLITIRDILNFYPEIYPELNELTQIREQTKKLRRIKKLKIRKFMHEGICEECGNQDILYKIDGRVVCEGCKEMM